MKSSIFRTNNGKNYLVPFVIISVLFLLSGYTNSLLDVLNKYFQEVLHISRAESGLVQFALYSGYFIMAIPAGLIINKRGYNKGLVYGLAILLFGTIIFIPGAAFKSYYIFLLALFIIACGFSFFETAANPYATLLGDKKGAARRINLAQAFNGLGWIFGPLIGGLIIFSRSEVKHFSYLPVPFAILGICIFIILLFIINKPLPEIEPNTEDIQIIEPKLSLPFYKYPHFTLAVLAQFFYVAAQTGINSFFINFVTETNQSISNQQASVMLSLGGMSLFVIGRFTGSYFLKWIKPHVILSIYAACNVLCMLLVIQNILWVSIGALFSTYYFMSVMYPTIFSLGIKNLGNQTKKASSYLVMALVGGALCPIFMGWIADKYDMPTGFIIPAVCFLFILYYGISGYKIKIKKNEYDIERTPNVGNK